MILRNNIKFIQCFTLLSSISIGVTLAHEHHHTGPADDSIPIDFILWLHMSVQFFTWMFLFPTAMIMGLTRHRLHVPVGITALLLTFSGYVLGHSHGGRSFPRGAHGSVASLLIPLLVSQAFLGSYLKAHFNWQGEAKVRPIVIKVHSFIGKLFIVLGWLQMVLGVITLRSWCRGGHTGQCLAHGIMGSAFIAYGIILIIMCKIAVNWLKRRKLSQEFLDSTVIFLWGIVNSLTEHQGGPWTHKDLQHTLLGVVWFFGGMTGMLLSRKGKRSVIPAIVIILTGYAMSGHAQSLMISTMIHSLFGYTLMAAGISRIIEVCFILNDNPTGQVENLEEIRSSSGMKGPWFTIKAFQYVPIWLLFASGVLFMSATDEELKWADNLGIDAITWSLIDFSLAFFLFFWANVLIDFYINQGGYMGSRIRNQFEAQNGHSVELGQNNSTLYERLSLGDSGGSRSNEEQTLHGSADSGESAESLELNRLKKLNAKKVNSNSNSNQNHVLFDEDDQEVDEEEEDDDPFDDERRQKHVGR